MLSEEIFMNLESDRFKRVASGEERIVINMDNAREFVSRHPIAFENTPSIADDEIVDINDLMIYNKSVFDMCNEILGELHQLRHFGKENFDIFSKKSAFANRILAETMPLTRDFVKSFVLKRVKKHQMKKQDMYSSTRSLDSLADASKSTEEFERQYNFLLAQSIDETTDILMGRLLLDTVQFFRNIYAGAAASDA